MIVHWAGPVVRIGAQRRQRCCWCGYALIDEDLRGVAVAIDPASDPRGDNDAPPAWADGAHVAVDGGVAYVVEVGANDPLPAEHCGKPWSLRG